MRCASGPEWSLTRTHDGTVPVLEIIVALDGVSCEIVRHIDAAVTACAVAPFAVVKVRLSGDTDTGVKGPCQTTVNGSGSAAITSIGIKTSCPFLKFEYNWRSYYEKRDAQ